MERLNNFGLAYPFVEDYADCGLVDYKGSALESERFLPVVIEGSELYETLCPVSKFTGHRENPLALLGKITGADSSLLNAVLQELPTVASDPRLSDQDRADWLVSRFASGTPAENAIMAKHIMNDLEAFGLKSVDASKSDVDSSKIDFSSTDAPVSNDTV